MNTRQVFRKIISRKNIGQWAAVTAMLVASAMAQADMLSASLYGNELDRCTAEMRSRLNLDGVSRMQHTLTDIDKSGAWYVFDIRTMAYDASGTILIDATTHCQANRWTDETIVEVRTQPATESMRVVSAD